MELEVVKADKGDFEFKISNLTVAEILRVYLNEQEVDFAAWRREHPFKPLLMKVKSSNVKKSVSDAVSSMKKDLDKVETSSKKK